MIRPNRSLSLRGMIWLFLAYIGLMSVIALALLGTGAWMVLPFAGLEAVVIATIFYYLVYRHTDDHELVTIDGETLSIIKREGRSRSRNVLPRYWTKLKLERSSHHWYPSRLLLRSYGRSVEIGAGIREQDRHALAEQLKTMLGHTAYT